MKSQNNKKIIIGMIHLPPTLSFSGWSGVEAMINKAKQDLGALETGGINAALIENDADHPCQILGTTDVVSPMSIVAYELSKITSIPLGIEVLLNDPKASLAIAKTCGLSFIRADYFADKMYRKNYGQMTIDPTGLLKYQDSIGAKNIKIYSDVQVKYATLIDTHKTIARSVKEAISSGSKGVIITGSKTGDRPLTTDILEAKKASGNVVPVIVGSGLTYENAPELLKYADMAIVGSSIKTGEYVDVNKVKKLMKQV